MTTVVTGAGLIGTAFAQNAIARGEMVVFVDPEPRADFLRLKLGETGYAAVHKDVRDLPGLIETTPRMSGAQSTSPPQRYGRSRLRSILATAP